jgi:hypothetical protein
MLQICLNEERNQTEVAELGLHLLLISSLNWTKIRKSLLDYKEMEQGNSELLLPESSNNRC